MASMMAPSSPIYTVPKIFGPFPLLPSKYMVKLQVARFKVKLNWVGLSLNPKSHMVGPQPPRLHFSYLTGNSENKLYCPGFLGTWAFSGSI
ncbi:unnamed protein product [Nyctereutes procyonoides]|uniref:(raccoon dog) hypothetical protein n=1 Tax=Nyctereutes procyonoides TaxID=34880 RepID=A0A811ZCK7_NYCPR|nr:unnamed protein product [Nyctereutes procyonoides]